MTKKNCDTSHGLNRTRKEICPYKDFKEPQSRSEMRLNRNNNVFEGLTYFSVLKYPTLALISIKISFSLSWQVWISHMSVLFCQVRAISLSKELFLKMNNMKKEIQ